MTRALADADAAVAHELSDALSRLPASPTTRSLTTAHLELDQSPTHSLIGLDYSGAHAICYHTGSNTAVAIGMGATGLADTKSEIVSFTDRGHLRQWIGIMSFYWGWLHPRYR